MRAIDLYAGIGGWSLGLRLAGIEVVASYEWWKPAIATHNANHDGAISPTDIRKLKLTDLPSNIDLVVGSPPCTEFSYANRGGNGDLAEGWKDLVKFFEIVDHVRPRYWAMENVPRVAELLRQAFQDEGHPLSQYKHLCAVIDVFDFAAFGTPQSRRRCIATNIPLELLHASMARKPPVTLGAVVSAFEASSEVIDPIWGVTLTKDQVTDTNTEDPLNAEELRMNREAKSYHPVYNNMAFPDPMDQPARTVTATCTRVSRESIVVESRKKKGSFRRLSIRERASLQGFPITYQFMGRSFAEKAKMIGNAIPPTFTYVIGLAAQGLVAGDIEPHQLQHKIQIPASLAPFTKADSQGTTYSATRAFRAAIPGLRFKSGTRFDLSNTTAGDRVDWKVRFFFGSSTDIRQIPLDGSAARLLKRELATSRVIAACQQEFAIALNVLRETTPMALQSVWSHREMGYGPYEVTDLLGTLAGHIQARLAEVQNEADLVRPLLDLASRQRAGKKPVSELKLTKNAVPIVAGLVVGDWFNTLDWHEARLNAA